MFIDQLSDYMMEVLSEHSNNVVIGDFKIHVNNHNDVDAGLLLDTMSALGLDQKVKDAIHNKGNTIDLVFIEKNARFSIIKLNVLEFISDHHPWHVF